MQSMERASSIQLKEVHCNAMRCDGEEKEREMKGKGEGTVTGQNRMHRWTLYGW